MKKKRAIGIVICIILYSLIGGFYYLNNKNQFISLQPKNDPLVSQQKIVKNEAPTGMAGHKFIDLGNGNGTYRDDECLTNDFKYVSYGLKRVIYIAKPDDNLWNILSYNLDQQDLVKKLTSIELSRVLDSVKDGMKSMSFEDIKNIGISSGNIAEIKTGDKINISPLLLDVSKIYEKTGINLLKFQTSSQYKKNDKYVCWEKLILPGADPSTFIAFDNSRSMDKNTVYSNYQILRNSDPNSLVFLSRNYSLDSKSVYYNGEVIEGADVKSFQVLNGAYAKDINAVYYLATKIEGVDPTKISFNGYLRSGDNIYRGKDIMVGVNADKFTVISDGYSKDDRSVYSEQNKIQGADPQTFQVFNISYTGDANNVFCNGRILVGANVDTFNVPDPILKGGFAEDRDNTYMSCIPTPKQK